MKNKIVTTMVTLDRWELTYKTLQSYLDTTARPETYLIVVDNFSTEHNFLNLLSMIDEMRKFGSHVHVVRLQERTAGIGLAVNIGWYLAQRVKPAIYMKVDNDIILPVGWEDCVERLAKTAGLFGIAPEPGPKIKILKIRGARVAFPMSVWGVRFIWGACLGIREDTMERVGFFDETIPRDEDWEYSGRCSRMAVAGIYDPELRVIHLARPNPTEGTEEKLAKSKEAQRSLEFRRHIKAVRLDTFWKRYEGQFEGTSYGWNVPKEIVLEMNNLVPNLVKHDSDPLRTARLRGTIHGKRRSK